MLTDNEAPKKICENSGSYDAEKAQLISKIHSEVKAAIEKLSAVERELVERVGSEAGENLFFSRAHKSSEPGSTATEGSVAGNVSADVESFFSLLREIESFRVSKAEEKEEKEKKLTSSDNKPSQTFEEPEKKSSFEWGLEGMSRIC